MSFWTAGEGWATWVGECCNQADAFEYTSILSMGFFNLFFFSFFSFLCCEAVRYCTFPTTGANTQLRLNTGVTEPQGRGENEEMELSGTIPLTELPKS
jgi:hypothetical protein